MEEISVVVQQEVGKISWNFEEIKKNLQEQLDVYKKTVYTDDTIKTAKTDVASLRKLAKDIDARKKEVKDKCLEPYMQIEEQAKELTKLIEEPINAINAQVKDYEARRVEAAKAKIDEWWNCKVVQLPEDIRALAYKKIYDSRWTNATSTMKAYREGIDNGINAILKDIETIKSFNSEYEEDMMKVYKEELNLQPAIMKMNQMNAQKERILEAERRKKEAAERQAQLEAERKAKEEAEKDKAEEPKQEWEEPQLEPKEEKKQFEDVVDTAPKAEEKEQTGKLSMTLTIEGTQEQLNKIKGFISWTGATYKEAD